MEAMWARWITTNRKTWQNLLTDAPWYATEVQSLIEAVGWEVVDVKGVATARPVQKA